MSDKKSEFSQIEEELIKTWEEENTFEESVENRKGNEQITFYDGPPYANGLPHHGHVVPVSIKDSLTRYKTMRGYYVPRRLGWDTHGLPVENKIEKELGFQTKQDIVDYGIGKFNEKCRQSVFRYKEEWERFFDRIGRWADKENAYATLENSYIESIWWAFKEIYDKGLVYQSYRSMPYCPRCATPLSNFEVNQGYQDDVEDPSVFMKFQSKDEDYKLVAWTTTPWTLPGNAALAVNRDENYALVKYVNDEDETENLVLAKKRLSEVDGEFEVQKVFKGEELVGQTYEPLFELDLDKFEPNENLYKVWSADFVGMDEGTGVVHVAPAFGEDDMLLGKENNIPVLQTVNELGHVKEDVGLGELGGMFFKKADREIIERLGEEGKLFAAETIRHTYPFCWRCDMPLMYYAIDTWMVEVTKIKDKLLETNQEINWLPEHIKDGRFGNWLEGARDWGISRNRFWGAPIPVWQCKNEHTNVFGSVSELKNAALNAEKIGDLHRPYVDDVEVECQECGEPAKRIEEVFDVWFESGSMPYAQDHYPFENKESIDEHHPAEFIAESIDQTRGWFYTLHVLSGALFEKPAAKNIVVSGWVMAADGLKLSKRLKNYVPVDEVFDEYGADTLRYFMLTSPVVNAESVRFSSDAMKEIQRNVFMTLWNVKKFFNMYSEIDGWKPELIEEPKSDNVLDKWMLSRLNQAITKVTEAADNYEVAKATRPIRGLIDDLSNWYVRRSRRRFWKEDDDEDKEQAYQTLHYSLVRVCQLLAPWAPFLSDHIYRELTDGLDVPSSVHLSDWPAANDYDEDLIKDMRNLRESVAEALSQRADAGIKVRQPLQSVVIITKRPLDEIYVDLIKDEVNVKEVTLETGSTQEVRLDTEITDELKKEGLMRDLIRRIQNFRKKSGLEVDDRIKLAVTSEDELIRKVLSEHSDTIKEEVLAVKLLDEHFDETKQVRVDKKEVTLSLEKHSD